MITLAPTDDRRSSSITLSQIGSRRLNNALVNATRTISRNCHSSIQQNVSDSYSNSEATFLGVNWAVLGQETTALGFLLSIPKILKVFADILVRLAQAATAPLTIDCLVPGTLRHALPFANKLTEIEKRLVETQACLHRIKIKYYVAREGLPFTLKSCISIFNKIYTTKVSEYRTLCEESFKEVYKPYFLNANYHNLLFAQSYTNKIGDFVPLLKNCIPPLEEEIEEGKKKGQLITVLSDIDIPQLPVSEILELFNEKFGTPHTSALVNQTLKYEKKLQPYQDLKLDKESDFADLCLCVAYKTSSAMIDASEPNENGN